MVVGEDVATAVAPEPLEENLDCAYVMVVVKDARWRIALKVQKGYLVFASPMVVAGGVSLPLALKVLKEAPCSVKHMVAENGALLKDALKVPKEVPLSVKGTAGENVVHLKVVVFVLRVFMAGPYFVSHMVAEKDVLYLVAPEVQGGGLIAVFAMVVVSGANLRAVGKALRVALTTAKPMVVEKDARGDNLVQNSVMMMVFVMRLLEGRTGCVHHTVLWFRIDGCTVVPL